MPANSIPRHQRPTGLDELWFGAPYYPEHWSEQDRENDVSWMAEAGVNVVRMAEFAWDVMEPARGQFDFSLFDETIRKLSREGIRTILCTPTATPPAWLTCHKPHVLRVDADGRAMVHGSRQHACTTSPDYRAESRRITQAMANHYADNPSVIAWQTDNEFHCHFSQCCCRACEEGFQEFLAEKYVTIDELNQAWGNHFWALTFDSFEQIPLPHPEKRPAYPNPAHELDYYRFLSAAVTRFQAEQVEILRRANPKWRIFHNGIYRNIDYWSFSEALDFLGVDVYPAFSGTNPSLADCGAFLNQTCRAASGGYIVPEQQSSSGGQRDYMHEALAPGVMRLWAYQSIAHGSDGILHFRWRTPRFGAEMYWHGVVDHDNVRRRTYEEFAGEGNELKRIGPKVASSVLDVQAAVLWDQDSDWGHTTMPNELPSPRQQAQLAFKTLWQRKLPCGLVDAADDFSGLKLAIWPSLPLIDEATAGKLTAFVENGGVLLVTARSAVRNRENQIHATGSPGPLAKLLGVKVVEFGKFPAGSAEVSLRGSNLPAGGCYEILDPDTAQTEATWKPLVTGEPFYPELKPAISFAKVGKGTAIYVGTYLTDENRAALVELALEAADLRPLCDDTEWVEVTRRVRQDGLALRFVLNHGSTSRRVTGLGAGTDLITGEDCDGSIELAPKGVAVIEEL